MERYKNFEDFLQEKHIQANPCILDDEIPDHFNHWLEYLDVDDLIKFADEYAKAKVEEYQTNLGMAEMIRDNEEAV